MANVAITNKDTISTLSLPSASVPLGGTLKMTGFSNIRIIKDLNSNAIRDVEGYPFSLLTNFEMLQSDGSKGNAKLSGNKYINNFPSSLVSFKVNSDSATIGGTMDTAYPSSLRHFVLVGYNTSITGPVPTTLSSNVDTINISGKLHNFSGSNFIPSTIPSGVFNYIVTDNGNNVGTHTSALPINLDSNSNNLNRFNVLGCKLTGDLPTSIGSAMKIFKIGGRANDGQYHSGISQKWNDAATAPDGTNTAYEIKEDNTFGRHRLFQYNIPLILGRTYTFSCYIKKNSSNRFFFLNAGHTIGTSISVDLDTMTSTNSAVVITDEGNGWHRVSISGTCILASGSAFYQIQDAANVDNEYQGDGSSSFYLWGAQVEEGSTVGTYTATGSNISGDGHVSKWYDQSANGNHAFATGAAYQPKIVENSTLITRQGVPSIKSGNSAHTFLDLPQFSLSADGQQSLFSVIENDVTSTGGYPAVFRLYSRTDNTAHGSNGANRRPYWFISKSNANVALSVDSYGGKYITSRDRRVISHVMNGTSGQANGTSTVHEDGVQTDTRTITLDANSNISTSTGHRRMLETYGGDVGELHMSELIYYTSDQTSNRAAIETGISNLGLTTPTTRPLDVDNSAALAFSLRNLSSSYTGNVVDVRRSSDNQIDSFTAAEVANGDIETFVGGNNLIKNSQEFSSTGWGILNLDTAQAFPSFSACTGLNTLTITNLKSSTTSRITSCASTVFTNCAFTTNANVNLSFNAFTSGVTNDVLVALNAANTNAATSGRVINLQGNRPPTGMTATKTKTQIAAGQSTGNTSLDSLITKDWTIQYFTDAAQAIYNWPS